MLAEVIHGLARTAFLAPLVGDFRARQIAVVTGSVLILAITLLASRWMRLHTRRQLITVGLMWVALTVTFELVLGRLMLEYSWNRIASDYDLTNGGLLPLGLAAMALSPWLAERIRRKAPLVDRVVVGLSPGKSGGSGPRPPIP